MRGTFFSAGVAAMVTLLIATSLGGCRAVEKSAWRKRWLNADANMPMNLGLSVTINNEKPLVIDPKSHKFTGAVAREHVIALHTAGLHAHAAAHADLWERAAGVVERELGFEFGPRLELLVIPVEKAPMSWHIASSGTDAGVLTIPIFVERSPTTRTTTTTTATTAATTAATSASSTRSSTAPLDVPSAEIAAAIYAYVHEWTEMTLFLPNHGYRTLPDIEVRVLALPYRTINHTRWFRDGYANFAGHLVTQAALSPDWPMSDDARRALRNSMHGRPFSRLDRVGTKLFKWHQYSPDEWDWECYDAALGLFLLIEERYGREAIREITRSVRTLEFPDGPALLWACNHVLGADIRRMIEQFDYPDMGVAIMPLKYDAATAKAGLPDGALIKGVTRRGPADRAGLKEDDTIVAVDGQRVRNSFEFEQAIFERIGNRSVKLSVRRKEQTIEREVELRDAT